MNQKSNSKHSLRIFLSYTSSDRAYANKLRNLLSRYSNAYIFTKEALSAGEDWQSKLKDELYRCDIFFVLLSPNSIDSAWVLQELGAAWALGKPIIYILTNPEILSKLPLNISESEIQIVKDIKDFEKPDIINKILRHYEKVQV